MKNLLGLAMALALFAFPACTNTQASATDQASASASATGGADVENPRGPEGEGDVVTPVVATLIDPATAEAVRGSDGRYHLAYELLLTNASSGPATIDLVSIVNVANGSSVLTLTGAELIKNQALREMNRAPAKDATLPSSTSRIVLLSPSFPTKGDIPQTLHQLIAITTADPISNAPSPVPTRFAYMGARLLISRKAPPTLKPPLEGDGWLASDGCCDANSHHINAVLPLNGMFVVAERYAIDWIRVDPAGRMYVGDRSKPSNWVGYGANVLAVADGTVIWTRDGLKDGTPPVMPDLPFDEIPGNNVVLDMGNSLYAVYAHLKPRSLKVRPGQHVRAGEVIGLLGNSGGSSAPHLHFHIVSGPSAATSDGVPYVVDSFSLAGQTTFDDFVKALLKNGGQMASGVMSQPVQHTNELPLDYTIVNFAKTQ